MNIKTGSFFLMLIITIILIGCIPKNHTPGHVKFHPFGGMKRPFAIMAIQDFPWKSSLGRSSWTDKKFSVDLTNIVNHKADQKRPDLCWAASMETILKYYGINITQCEILSLLDMTCKSSGSLIATHDQIYSAMYALPINKGRVMYATLDTRGIDIVEDMKKNRPIMIGLKGEGQVGHIYVIKRALFYLNKKDFPIFESFELVDPWPGREKIVKMNADEVARKITFTMRSWPVSKRYLVSKERSKAKNATKIHIQL